MDGSTRSSKSSPSCCARQGRVSKEQAQRGASAAPHRVDARQLRNLRPRQHSQRQVHLLQVCAGTRASSVSETALALGTAVAFRPAGARCGSGAPAAAREGCSCVRGAALLCAVACGRPSSERTFGASDRADAPRARADVEDDSLLQPRHQKVGALARRLRQHALQPVKEHSLLSAVHCVRVRGATRQTTAQRRRDARSKCPQAHLCTSTSAPAKRPRPEWWPSAPGCQASRRVVPPAQGPPWRCRCGKLRLLLLKEEEREARMRADVSSGADVARQRTAVCSDVAAQPSSAPLPGRSPAACRAAPARSSARRAGRSCARGAGRAAAPRAR